MSNISYYSVTDRGNISLYNESNKIIDDMIITKDKTNVVVFTLEKCGIKKVVH